MSCFRNNHKFANIFQICNVIVMKYIKYSVIYVSLFDFHNLKFYLQR